MTFRRRIVLLAAAAVALAIALAVTITYIIVRHDLRDSVDRALRITQPEVVMLSKERAPESMGPPRSDDEQTQPLDVRVRVPNAAFGDAIGIAQATLEGGATIRGDARELLPVTEAVRAVAAGKRGPFIRDETVNGVHLRVFTRPGANGEALQIARSLTETDATLGRLRWVLAAVMFGGVGLAAALGLGVSRAATRPLARLTATAEQVTATGELHHRIPAGADDEPGRLAAAFNAMLSALERSRDAQRQLVADASHELRTPLTAIRANIELLEHAPQLAPVERAAMLRSARGQLEDLTVLVGDLVDLGAGPTRPREADPPEELRLDELVGAAVERARRHAPAMAFTLDAEPSVVIGCRARLARAVGNLLDNAVKWSPPDATVEVTVAAAEVTVRDHGPGIAQVDLPHVFDRFYRAPAARGLPGSGLGLAIVKHVADAHGGTVVAEAAPGGGTLLRLTLPVS
jgi:two-component system, OmpR family, sensor histidine kinase MprB